MSVNNKTLNWPELPFNDWKETLYTVQLWTQIVGKIRLRSMPWLNHSWHVTLYVTPRGLTTGTMPYKNGVFEIEFDFINHTLTINTSEGETEQIKLISQSVAAFYKQIFSSLEKLNIEVSISPIPNEIEPAIPFYKDENHTTYDPNQVHRFWLALVQIEKVFTKFRAGFKGKCSPVHFFWGSFDLAVTRFSGRTAPKYSGAVANIPIAVMQEAYSHEVSSCGFWPGSEAVPFPAFYSYCYPSPAAFGAQGVQPKEAFFNKEMGEFFLMYDVVRTADNPEKILMQFLVSTYEAAANTGNWDREALECDFSSFKKR